MTDQKKITLIYVGVAVVSVMIIGMGFFLRSLKKVQREQQVNQAPLATDVGKATLKELTKLGKDIELQRANGETVRLFDLKDKVWLAAQFYATCPECAERNRSSLVQIYQEFKDEEDFLVACFSVDPENDTPELLSDVRKGMGLADDNWWFLRTDREALWDYMTEEMYFTTIKERKDPIHIAQKGRYAHDLGYRLYRGDVLVHAWHEGLPLDQLREEIKDALKDLREAPKTVSTDS